MFTVDSYIPTRVVFGAGRLDELATLPLPGKKALICTTPARRPAAAALVERVRALVERNGASSVIFDHIAPNPTKRSVEEGTALALREGCDFLLGLGGGSSIDCAKAIAVMLRSPGSLWDYAYTGTGGKKTPEAAAPLVTVTTTCGTGTECDPYCVITNEETGEKLDFASDALFPVFSIIDPELLLSLPRDLSIYQGFDGLFHAAECYVCNGHANRMVDLYALESVRIIARSLPAVLHSPDNLEERAELAFACDILSGYTQALTSVTSHHILGQTLGGLFPEMPHGATLITVAEAYYSKVCALLPGVFDELGEAMGVPRESGRPGFAFVAALQKLMDDSGCRTLCLKDFGISRGDFRRIVDMTVDQVGISLDRYTLTKEDMTSILADSLSK